MWDDYALNSNFSAGFIYSFQQGLCKVIKTAYKIQLMFHEQIQQALISTIRNGSRNNAGDFTTLKSFK